MNMMIMMMSIIFLFLNHPLSFGLILLLQSILISSITGFMNFNFWFSYILFLIMVGGMLVLFIYMTSIASDEKFKFSFKTMMLILIMLMISFMLLFMDNFYYSFLYKMFDSMNQNDFKNNYLSMNKYINFPNNFIMFMMIMYLFITLIMVVKITNIHYGPLRQKF
uniref:NADH-ubiquinone oxidoreductase chain 6 n=1 Tax=Gonioctena intermedia TaxID=63691 RepID=A0A1L5IYU6_GONIN|nr:NADH dehydrogenase subunit 6 [Gonioctena intermedia]APM86026.1 NADH dehydrogenase subunit 6 [Gonioctena intermedia]AVX29551.1 NADH dehydrogenase subunit 6 [Gonioctena intermedia]AVX29564.1 NADH dehydrogenase subunit 6 [Gonioctena intermedia]